MYQHRTEALTLSLGYHRVKLAGTVVPGGKRDQIAVSHVLRAQSLRMEHGLGLAVLVEHSVAADCFGGDPKHFSIGAAAHKIQKGGDVKRCAEDGEIGTRPHSGMLMGNAVQLPADVQYLATKGLLADCARAELIVQRLGGHEGPIISLIQWGSLLPKVAPFRIAVPVHEANQSIIYLVDEPPCPIPPIGRESLDRRSPNQRSASTQVWIQPLDYGLGHFLIDPPIMLKREKAASYPGVIRLVPYAPVPTTHSLAAPLLNAATHDVRRSVSKRSNRPWIVERRSEFSESNHR